MKILYFFNFCESFWLSWIRIQQLKFYADPQPCSPVQAGTVLCALKREHPAFKNMKILYFFQFLWLILALLDPDPATQTKCGSTALLCCAGWYGAMCQGQAISVLCRAFHVSKDPKYLKAARAAVQVFQKSSKVSTYYHIPIVRRPCSKPVLCSVDDPGSGAFLIQDSASRIGFFPDLGSQNYIFDSLMTNFGYKYNNF
jgi:hypothetical protein